MSYVSLDQLPTVINEFAMSRLIPNLPPFTQFIVGGALGTIQSNLSNYIMKYEQPAKMLNLLNDKNQINVEGVRSFLHKGFEASHGKISMYGITLDQEEGEALLGILEAHKTEEI